MLPRKAIIAIVIASLLLLGYEGLSDKEMNAAPNLLVGFTLVGAFNALRSLKDFKQIA